MQKAYKPISTQVSKVHVSLIFAVKEFIQFTHILKIPATPYSMVALAAKRCQGHFRILCQQKKQHQNETERMLCYTRHPGKKACRTLATSCKTSRLISVISDSGSVPQKDDSVTAFLLQHREQLLIQETAH